MNVLPVFKKIKVFVLDVDGVLTDSSILVLNDGQMARRMNIKDGYALQLAIKKGYKVLVISGGTSDAVKIRLQNLGVEDVHLNINDKKRYYYNIFKCMGYYGRKCCIWEMIFLTCR